MPFNGQVSPPTQSKFPPILQKTKDAYALWFESYQILPKAHRYSLGVRIDTLFIETIEMIAAASFLGKTEKLLYVRIAIRKIDTVKVLLRLLWEMKSLKIKEYIALSEKLNPVGRMLGGWSGQLIKQNSPEAAGRRTGEK